MNGLTAGTRRSGSRVCSGLVGPADGLGWLVTGFSFSFVSSGSLTAAGIFCLSLCSLDSPWPFVGGGRALPGREKC